MSWRYGFTGFIGVAVIAATLIFGQAGSALFALFALLPVCDLFRNKETEARRARNAPFLENQ